MLNALLAMIMFSMVLRRLCFLFFETNNTLGIITFTGGDLNAHFGAITGDKQWNLRGHVLQHEFQLLDVVILNAIRFYGRSTYFNNDTLANSSINFIAVQKWAVANNIVEFEIPDE